MSDVLIKATEGTAQTLAGMRVAGVTLANTSNGQDICVSGAAIFKDDASREVAEDACSKGKAIKLEILDPNSWNLSGRFTFDRMSFLNHQMGEEVYALELRSYTPPVTP